MGQDITSVRFHRPGCRGGTPARRFAERPSPMAVQQNISCPAFAFAVRASMAKVGQHTGHHSGSLCQMLKNHAVNAVIRGFVHAAPVRHFVKKIKVTHIRNRRNVRVYDGNMHKTQTENRAHIQQKNKRPGC